MGAGSRARRFGRFLTADLEDVYFPSIKLALRTVTFHEMETGSSVFAESSHFPRMTIRKTTQTLESVLAETAELAPDFAKLDVQGYELEVLRKADACTQPGEVGALLRSEGLYSSHLTMCRKASARGELAGLAPMKRGHKAAPPDPLAKKIVELERQVGRLTARAERAEALVEVQKKSPCCWGPIREREVMMTTVLEVGPKLGVAPTCAARGLSRETYYRRERPKVSGCRRQSSRALGPDEPSGILALLHEPRFVDLAPAQIYASFLDEGRFVCSLRTMHRILAVNREVRERRNVLRHPEHKKPEIAGDRPQPGVELGNHEAARPGEVVLLLPVRDPRHLQPLRRRLDCRRRRKRGPRGEAHPRNLRSAKTSNPVSSPSTRTAALR